MVSLAALREIEIEHARDRCAAHPEHRLVAIAYAGAAMVFNELCQFPGALASIRALRGDYRPDFVWLRDWRKAGGKKDELYGLALDTVEGKPVSVPLHVRSEWMRSPIFLSVQEELNLLLGERRLMAFFARDYKLEARRALEKFREASKEYKEEIGRASCRERV